MDPTKTETPPAPAQGSTQTPPAVPPVPPVVPPVAPAQQAAPPVETVPAPPVATPPAEVEIKLPEGVTVKPEVMQKFKALAKEHGLTGKAAQAFVDFNVELRSQEVAGFESYKKANTERLKADPEFGGQHFEANRAIAQKPLVKYGSPELVKELTAMGLENHPGLVKLFHKIGKDMGEDSTPRAPAPATQVDPEAALKARYPKSKF